MKEPIEHFKKKLRLSGNETISYDELSEWPDDIVTELQNQGYISQIDDADGIVCTECEESCYKQVEIRKDLRSGKLVGTYFCEDEDHCGPVYIDLVRLKRWQINKEKLGLQATISNDKKKKRPTKADMDNRNSAVLVAAVEIEAKYGRLPTVSEIMEKTKLTADQIYATAPYQENKIAKKSAKLTTEMTGSSVTASEQFGKKSIEGSRTNRLSETEQLERDQLIDESMADNARDEKQHKQSLRNKKRIDAEKY
jgi:hypothetical protein